MARKTQNNPKDCKQQAETPFFDVIHIRFPPKSNC
jgi:hypothetical protein